MASVRWSAVALHDLDSLDPEVAGRIAEKVNWLGKNVWAIVPEPLHYNFSGLYRLRVGDYRVVYQLRRGTISIEAIRHRRDAYR